MAPTRLSPKHHLPKWGIVPKHSPIFQYLLDEYVIIPEIIQPYTTTRRPQTYNTFCGTAQHSVEQFKQQRWGITAGVVLPAREISDLDRGYHSLKIVLNSDNLGGATIDPRWNTTKAELETIKGPSVSIANPERPDSFIIRPFPSLRRSLYFERDF
ncbi:fibronectin type-III domain-containing protein [Trichonephila clavata]|uniref:Fibronectin type-III domain-containing protein n=1 Tax=Trichonephila clavata TaxID=2740835 RepID=A0A8X6LIZ6_TRICU|nr:fibronectin type-III domain-containing protein [Trichonephila clavata]